MDDPLVLPYRFQLEYFHTGPKPTQIVPVDFDGDGRLESYQIQIGRDEAENLSSVLLYDCVHCGNVIEQYNYDNVRITDTHVCDLDGNGLQDIVVLFANPDTLFAEIIDPKRGRIFRTVLSTGTDPNGDGIWDVSGFVAGCEDLTGDGALELLLAVDVGFDLYTRELICLDWTSGQRVWSYEVAGIITYDRARVIRNPENDRKCVVFGVASKGNAARANGMDDQHSYLICLDAAGGLLWRRVTGGTFSNPVPAFIRYDADSVPEILFSSSVAPD